MYLRVSVFFILTLDQISLSPARHELAATNQQFPSEPWDTSSLLAPSTNRRGFSQISWKYIYYTSIKHIMLHDFTGLQVVHFGILWFHLYCLPRWSQESTSTEYTSGKVKWRWTLLQLFSFVSTLCLYDLPLWLCIVSRYILCNNTLAIW